MPTIPERPDDGGDAPERPTTAPPQTDAPRPDGPPADATSPARRRRVLRGVAVAVLPLAALAVAWWATRGNGPATTAASGHDHAAMATGGASGEGARAVTLSGDQARRIGVTFAAVEASDLPRAIRTVGQVTFDETSVTTIAPKVEGWVERLHVDYTGRPIRRGEPLLAIYSPMLVTAQEELLLALRLARDVADRSAEARRDADDLVSSARRRLAYWDVPAAEIARIERSGEVRRALTLHAPTSGVVIEKRVTEGQRVMAGEALFRVADLSTIWVEGDVYEQDLRAVREGQPATAEFDAYPGERWTGRIAYVYPTLSPETRTARVRVALANAGLRLKPGMYATLHIEGAGRAGTPTVPRSAILATGERQIVFVRRPDGRLEPRLVQVGATSDDRAEIVRGVTIGDTVVASATFLLDAESNLGTALGGMGDMPGMEFTLPPAVSSAADSTAAARPRGERTSPPTMPGMPMPDARPRPAPPPASPPPPDGTAPGAGGDGGHAAHDGRAARAPSGGR